MLRVKRFSWNANDKEAGMIPHENCPACNAPVLSATNYGTTSAPNWCISWTCGRERNYDGPGKPCLSEIVSILRVSESG